jgi:hypothetical protein
MHPYRTHTMVISTRQFEPELTSELPDTRDLLLEANLVVHEAVSLITLHGSRGRLRGARSDSDVDLAFLVESDQISDNRESLFRDILKTTLQNWTGSVEVDLSVMFDKNNCDLHCMRGDGRAPVPCEDHALGCLGLYKIQKGFDGYVPDHIVDRSKITPYMIIWRNPL